MIEGDRGVVLRQVGALFRAGTFAGMSDGQLLESFLARGGEAGELAFSVLVERHGPMVLRVCRGVLGDRHDAEDAFQATFLALVRGAGAIRRRDSVAPWLHGAALRVAACVRTAGARRRKHEGRFAARAGGPAGDRPIDDLGAVLHEEVGRLPARYRAAVVLCDLEGLSLLEAARHLGCPVGTVKSRVARGRERLRARLVGRGVVPTSAAAVGLALAREARAAVRPALAETTARLALRFAAGRGTAGMLVSPAEWLARLDRRRLLMARLRTMTMALATTGVLAAGATLLGQFAAPGSAPAGGEARETRPTLLTKTYAVADLLAGSVQDGGDGPKYDMGPLVDLLASSVAPGTWRILNEDGRMARDGEGPGSIIPFHLSLSLIVRQTPEVHAQFAERLEQLRRVLGTHRANPAPPLVPMPPGGLPGPTALAPGAPGMMGRPGAPAAPMMPGMAGMSAGGAAMMGGPMGMPGMSHIPVAGSAPGQPPLAAPAAEAAPPGPQKPGAANLHPGRVAPGSTYTDSQLVPHVTYAPARPGGQTQYDVNIDYKPRDGVPEVGRREGASPREAETDRRLRTLEEKLDRVLKALDASRPEAPRAAGPRP